MKGSVVDLNELKKRLEQLNLPKNQYKSSSKKKNTLESEKVTTKQNNFQKESKKKILPKEKVYLNTKNFSVQDFILSSTLGTGTFGRVRQVKIRNDPTNNVYALKMLKKTEIVRLNQVDHIKSEKKILQTINHPFIVTMNHSFQDEFYVYMLFEYVCGGELFSRLRKDGRFSNDVALFYGTEIITALQYLHQQDIVYRDLKPENLLIDKDGHIKLADFGFAKRVENDKTFTLCGTPEYLAPEIIKGSRVGYGKSVDWWALGILIFEMLSGYPPFYDNEPIGIYKRILSGVIEFPRFFSVYAKDLIRKLLNPELSRRLGVTDDGESIKLHKWFRGVDWKMVFDRDIPAPWTPYIKNDEDSAWFEKYPDSDNSPKALSEDLKHLFDDYESY